jgi:ribosomal protein L29
VATKRFKELKNLTKTELASQIRDTESQLFQAKMKQATGQLTDTAMLWRLRKDIARMKMLDGSK